MANETCTTTVREIAGFALTLPTFRFGITVARHDAMNGTTYRTTVVDFKRRLVEATLREHGGNRTHAARALGVQRTYLLRLIRDLGVNAPQPSRPPDPIPDPR